MVEEQEWQKEGLKATRKRNKQVEAIQLAMGVAKTDGQHILPEPRSFVPFGTISRDLSLFSFYCLGISGAGLVKVSNQAAQLELDWATPYGAETSDLDCWA